MILEPFKLAIDLDKLMFIDAADIVLLFIVLGSDTDYQNVSSNEVFHQRIGVDVLFFVNNACQQLFLFYVLLRIGCCGLGNDGVCKSSVSFIHFIYLDLAVDQVVQFSLSN